MAVRPVLRAIALFVGISVGTSTVVAVANEGPIYADLPQLQKERSVPGEPVLVEPLPDNPIDAAVATTQSEPIWPEEAVATVPLSDSHEGTAVSSVENTKIPISIALAGDDKRDGIEAGRFPQVKIFTSSQDVADKAGVAGAVFAVADAGNAGGRKLSVLVDYSGFAAAYGGDYGSRLRVRQLPACALTTPEKAECREGRWLPTVNDVDEQQVSADITLPEPDTASQSDRAESVVLAVQSQASGSGGAFTATNLSPAGSWSAGGSSGDFTYSVPLRVPPSPGGLAPKLGIGYSSGTIDGRTSATNNQASVVGDGWELSAGGFVERQYKACSEDLGGNQDERKTGDLCWATDNAVLSLNGINAKLVQDSETGFWKPKNDDGSRVERLTGAHNGDNNGEHWKVTATDGTQYFFGLNRLPGWGEGEPETKSAFTVPVFGNNTGEPCHAQAFDDSWCQQAYRWNLDYVVDPNGNVTTYYYDTETNHYGRNQTASKQTPYVAAGMLRRIEYGLRSDDVFGPAPARVWFDTAQRCLPTETFECNADQLTPGNAGKWPDVPSDQICKSDDTCDNRYSPAFFTTKRLVKVLTQVRRDDVTNEAKWKNVDSWTLRHQFPDTGDGLSPALWLAGIKHTGLVGEEKAMPEIRFHGRAMPNRVDTGDDGLPPITRHRIERVITEAGGIIEISYSDRECVAGEAMPSSPQNNDMRCFPTWWVPEFGLERELGWFHKYVVVAVTEDGRTTGPSLRKTHYEYSGGAAWHFDEAVFTEMEYRTWSQWRGYGLVRTITGDPGTAQSVTEERFLRGMHGDRLPGGSRRSVTVKDSEGGTVTDHDQLAGFSRETLQYDGDELVSSSIKDPWVHGPTATSGDEKAYMTNVGAVRGKTLLSDGSWRKTEVNYRFDEHGNTNRVEDLGEVGKSGDETCARTTYAHNGDAWIHTLPSTLRVVALPCSEGEGTNNDVISDVRSSYDGQDHGVPPTKGNLTTTERWTGSKYELSQRTTYDELGRVVEVENVLGEKVTTDYSPGPGFPTRSVTKTDPKGFSGTTTFEPAWGQVLSEVGISGERADVEYDPLGRVHRVWLPGTVKARGDKPHSVFTYEYRTDAPTVVTTQARRDDGEYNTSYTLYDGLLRQRQSQLPAVSGGRILTDWFYDSRGLEYKVNGAYYNADNPSTDVLGVLDNAVPNQTLTEFDALGRETEVIYRKLGVEQWRTSTTYGGDRVTVVPPEGGTTTTVINDVNGNVVERRQHHGRDADSPFDETRYVYDAAGRMTSMSGPDGAEWTYEYDILGRKIADNDPDSGTTRYTYDALDRLVETTDARGLKLRTEYDELGRTVAQYEQRGPETPEIKTADWAYDELKPGLLDSATRWVDGHAYTKRVDWYDSALRPVEQSIVVPAAEKELAGTYTFETDYFPVSGKVSRQAHPAAGGLDAEYIQHQYNEQGLPTRTFGIDNYVSDHRYSKYGETLRLTLGGGADTVFSTFFYEEGTRRLDSVDIQRNTEQNSYAAQRSYNYDPAGNITRLADTPPGSMSDVQCFGYDYLQRLTTAFTPASGDCAEEPSVPGLGGAAPYWHDYTYDKGGNRIEEVQHSADGDIVRTYSYGAESGSQPHTLRSVLETGPNGTSRDEYDYDAAGNMTYRNVGGSPQEWEWDAAGRAEKVTEHDGRQSQFLYDADGERLLKRESGITTLYLHGMELVLQNTTREVTAKRYYTHAGQTVAVRTSGDGGGLSLLAEDHQGTSSLAFETDDLSVSQRRQDPFGNPRGDQPESWPDDKGFVGGVEDDTGLTTLGARQYESATGRFVSVDPVMDAADPQQVNGYAYANNSPVTNSDPNGLYWKTISVTERVLKTTFVAVMYWLAPLFPVFGFIAVSYWTVQVYAYRVWIEPPWKGQAQRHQQALAAAGLSAEEYEQAKQLAADKRSWVEVALQHGGEVLHDIIGVKGVVDNCINDFDLLGCGYEIASALPWSKILKIGEIVDKLIGAFKATVSWVKKRDAAQGLLRRVDAAKERLTRSGSSCSIGNSFVPGTLVLMVDGSRVPIEEVELGDRVLATDPVTGESASREVVATIVGQGEKDLVDVTVDADGEPGGAVETITATAEHPFWVDEHGRFIRPTVGLRGEPVGWYSAGDLDPGDQLLTPDGDHARIVDIRVYTATTTVHNLTINGVHTYYVGDENSVLNHNADGCRKSWELRRENASVVKRGGPFKTTFYKSSSDDTWWTPDVTGHGRPPSAYKVYKETKKGLEWQYDANKYGDYIEGKWKGGTGRFIPWSSLRGVK